MKPLPLFSDLFFLPRVIDPDAEVFVRAGVITVKSNKAHLIAEQLSSYPHLSPEVDADGFLLLNPKPSRRKSLLFVFPSGARYGCFLWDMNYYSIVSAEAVLEMIAGGMPAQVVKAQGDGNPEEALQAYLNDAGF